jgi:hypothetical protein
MNYLNENNEDGKWINEFTNDLQSINRELQTLIEKHGLKNGIEIIVYNGKVYCNIEMNKIIPS